MKQSMDIVKYRLQDMPRDMPFSVRSIGYGKLMPGHRSNKRIITFAHLIWTISGQGLQLRDGERFGVGDNSVCTYMPGDEHQLSCEGSEPWEYRWFTLDGLAIEVFSSSFGFGDAPFLAGECPVNTFLHLEKLINMPGRGATRLPVSIVFNILLDLIAIKTQECSSDNYPDTVSKGVKLICKRFSDPTLGVDILAEELGLHRSSFSRLFTQTMGINPKSFIDSVCLQEAKVRLRHSSEKIMDIALACGFRDANYFGKFFTRSYGCSPGVFRQLHDF